MLMMMINFLRIHLLPLGMQRDKRPSGLHSNLHRIHFWNILYASFDNNKFNFNIFNKFYSNIFYSIVFLIFISNFKRAFWNSRRHLVTGGSDITGGKCFLWSDLWRKKIFLRYLTFLWGFFGTLVMAGF